MNRLFFAVLLCTFSIHAAENFTVPVDTNGVLINRRGTNFFNTNRTAMVTALTNQTVTNLSLQGPKLTNATGTIRNTYQSNSILDVPILTNASGSLLYPSLISAGTGQKVTVTNTSGNAAEFVIDESDSSSGSGVTFNFAGAPYWSFDVTTNEFGIAGSGVNFITFANSSVYVGDTSVPTIIQGNASVSGELQNTTFTGTNKWNGDYSASSHTYSGMGNGDNGNIELGTNAVAELSGATTIANVISFLEKRAGTIVDVRFSGAVSNVIVNESLSVGTVTRRITTGLGLNGSIVMTNQPSYMRVRYNGTRWEVMSHSN